MSNGPVIPNMPPLSSIEDRNTRAALEAIVTGLRVRNGEIGDGTEKFLTVNDLLDGLTQRSSGTGGFLTSNDSGGLGNAPPSNRWIAPLLSRIDDSIQQSWLWKNLGERIDWIETPEWFADKFGAAIKTEQIQRQTETAALASAVNTVVTNINGNLALAKQELTATSNLAGATARSLTTLQTEVGGVRTTAQQGLTLAQTVDGTIKGAWTVKFDAAGYVAGAGFGLEGKNGNLQSAFYVRADRFAIGNPQYPGVTPRIPFKVFTTSQTLPDGTQVPAGVYMDEAIVYKLTGTYISAGSLDAGEIYTGSAWIDRVSKQQILSQPVGYYSLPGAGHLATYVRTGGSMRFYGPALHASAPLGQRIRGSQYGGNVTFILNASCTADHFFALWYRINGNDYWVPPTYTQQCYYDEYGDPWYCWNEQTGGGYVASTTAWNFISKTVEPQNDFGTAAVAGSVSLSVPNSTWWVDFGITITDENYSVMNGGDGKNAYVRDMYMYAFAVNV